MVVHNKGLNVALHYLHVYVVEAPFVSFCYKLHYFSRWTVLQYLLFTNSQ